MKKVFLFGQKIPLASVTVFLMTVLMLTPASFAQSGKEEWDRAVASFNDGQNRLGRSDFRGAIIQWEDALATFKKFGVKQAIGATKGNLGKAHIALGHIRQAIDCYEQALAIAEEIKDKRNEGMWLGNLGLAYSHLGETKKSIGYCERALAVAEEIGDKHSKGKWQGNLGDLYEKLGDYRKSIHYKSQALTTAEEIGDKKSKGYQLVNLGNAYAGLGDYRTAINFYEQGLTNAGEIGDQQGKGVILGNLGNIYSNLGDYRKAISYHRQALATAEEIGDIQNKRNQLGNMGIAYRSLGDYDAAISFYDQAFTIADQIGNKQGKGALLGNIGTVHADQGDFRTAIRYHEQALAIAEETGDRGNKGRTFANLGNAYSGLGDYRTAISFYEKALAVANQIGDKQSKGISLGNLARVFSDLGDYGKAISLYEQALAITEEIEDKQAKGSLLNNLGNTSLQLCDYQKAISFYERALAVFKQIGVPYVVPENNLADAYFAMDRDKEALAIYSKNDASIRLGRFYLKKKDFQKAIEQFDRDREKDEQQKIASFILARCIGLGLAHEGQKEYERAYGWYTKAIDIMEDQRSTLSPAEREHYFEGNELHIPRLEAYEGAVRCAFLLGRLADAFYWSENTKGRVLSELLSRRHTGASYKIPLKLAQEEDELTTRIVINKKQQRSAFQNNNPELLKRAEGEYTALRQKLEGLIDRLRKEYPQYAAIKYPQPVKLSHLALRKGEIIIEYEVTEACTIGLVIWDGKVVKAFKVEKTRAELENLVRKFRFPFQEGNDAGEFSLSGAKQLSDLLIRPALEEVRKGESLIIIPDECLSLLPFEALLLDAPADTLKEEAALLAQTRAQQYTGTLERRDIIRGLSKSAVRRGGGLIVPPRVSMNIFFDFGSAQVGKQSGKQTEEILAALKSKELDRAQIRIEGHTDSIGDPKYNLMLSKRRAEDVYNYLVKGGIKGNRLTFAGKGDTEPFADNRTEKGRKQNRRVDLVRLPDKSEAKSPLALFRSIFYAIDEYPISYYQSASVLSLQRGLQASRVKKPTFFGLGDPVFDAEDSRAASLRASTITVKKDAAVTDFTISEGTKDAGYRFSRLENTAKEIQEVSSLFSDSRILLGPDATKDNLKKEDLSSRRYVLFSTHGILGNEIPYIKQPALVLNLVGNKEEDGFLTASEIFNMDLNADLVGLSACQTGLGIQSAGEGVVGLSRAFMYAGTDSVLVSLWSVSDDSTYKLVVKFFEGLKQGKDKMTALKQAKGYLRQNGYDNPFYWAPFILVGEAN